MSLFHKIFVNSITLFKHFINNALSVLAPVKSLSIVEQLWKIGYYNQQFLCFFVCEHCKLPSLPNPRYQACVLT